MDQVFDIAIIGGGINGCGCAADASLRGLSVILFEQDDLASKTSSSSTKLIHGGLRYLEFYEFGLVRKALEERQRLLTIAPHLVHPQPFILPYQQYMRPAWLLRLGLFLYDYLSFKNHLPKCETINNKKSTAFIPLHDGFKKGFRFYDATTDDARLTITNAIQAKNQGAHIRPRSKVIKTEIINKLWHLTIQPQKGPAYQIQAKSIINATGPWVETTAKMTQTSLEHSMALVKGSHIVVPKMYEGNQAYFLQHEDKRIVFVIPYHGYSMIGTTDVPFNASLEQVHISTDEIDYLTAIVNSYFKTGISSNDIIYAWSGIRPLLAAKDKEARSLSRDYCYEVSSSPAPIITILGGKITTYRQLAEEIINQLRPIFPELKDSITRTTPLPGATLGEMSFTQYVDYAKRQYSWLKPELLHRYLHSYGSNTERFLARCTNMNSMGNRYGTELYQVELDYLISEEWAQDCDDILIRRTKLGLNMAETSKNELKAYLESCFTTAPTPPQAELEYR